MFVANPHFSEPLWTTCVAKMNQAVLCKAFHCKCTPNITKLACKQGGRYLNSSNTKPSPSAPRPHRILNIAFWCGRPLRKQQQGKLVNNTWCVMCSVSCVVCRGVLMGICGVVASTDSKSSDSKVFRALCSTLWCLKKSFRLSPDSPDCFNSSVHSSPNFLRLLFACVAQVLPTVFPHLSLRFPQFFWGLSATFVQLLNRYVFRDPRHPLGQIASISEKNSWRVSPTLRTVLHICFQVSCGLLGHNNFRRRKSCKKGAPTLVYIFFLNLSSSFLRISGLNSSCFGNGSAGGFLNFFRSKKNSEGYLTSFLVVSQVPPCFSTFVPGIFFNPSLHFSPRFRHLFLSSVFEVPPTLFDISCQVPAPLLLTCVPRCAEFVRLWNTVVAEVPLALFTFFLFAIVSQLLFAFVCQVSPTLVDIWFPSSPTRSSSSIQLSPIGSPIFSCVS